MGKETVLYLLFFAMAFFVGAGNAFTTAMVSYGMPIMNIKPVDSIIFGCVFLGIGGINYAFVLDKLGYHKPNVSIEQKKIIKKAKRG